MVTGLRFEHWLSLVLGCVLGLAVGLVVTWQVWPVQYYDTDPIDLRAEHKEDYVALIAAAYAQDRNLELAGSRLEELGLEDARQTVLDVFEKHSRAGYEEDSRSLARLAYDMGLQDVALAPYLQTPTSAATIIVSPTVTVTPEASAVPTGTVPVQEPAVTPTEPPPEATPTPAPAEEFDFQLVERSDLGCSGEWGGDYILVYVQDEQGRGLAGVQVMVSAPAGEDAFFTGLKPEVDPGFADFLVTGPGTYSVQVLDGTSQVAEDITFEEAGCPSETPHRSWRVVFRQVNP